MSEFQARKPNPHAKLISTLFWKDGQVGQHVLPITRNGEPYVVFVDEYGRGGPRIIDIGDERHPVIVYYCSVDRRDEPTILVCSNFMSGVRVFDIRDFGAPREIAYFNPGGDGKMMPGSYGGTTAGYTPAAPRIIADSGEIWFTDMDAGFFVTKFADGVCSLRP